MAADKPHKIDPGFYYGTIEGAVRLGLNTRDIWSLIRDQAENAGLASPGINAAEVSRMRGQAAQTRGADAQLARAEADRALDASMISRARWHRPEQRMGAAPMWQVNFRHTTMVNGVESSDWRTLVIRGNLPSTVKALQRRIDRAGQQLAADYEVEHLGVSDLSILEI